MKGFFCRIYGFYGREIKSFVKNNILKITIICLVILFGIFMGFLTCNKYRDDIEIENILNMFLIKILDGSGSIGGILFFEILISYVILLLIYLLSCNLVLYLILYILLWLVSYIIGFDICILSCLWSFVGIVYAVITTPCILILFSIMALFMVYCRSRHKINNRCSNIFLGKGYVLLFFLFSIFIMLMLYNVLFFTIRLFIVVN